MQVQVQVQYLRRGWVGQLLLRLGIDRGLLAKGDDADLYQTDLGDGSCSSFLLVDLVAIKIIPLVGFVAVLLWEVLLHISS